jgi:hypothetical protein
MSEPRTERLGQAGGLAKAMRMVIMGKHYTPRLEEMLQAMYSFAPLGPEHEPARSRYATKLAKYICEASPNELRALAALKELKGKSKPDVGGWLAALKFALEQDAAKDMGKRTSNLTTAELHKFLIARGYGHLSREQRGNLTKAIRKLGVPVDVKRMK